MHILAYFQEARRGANFDYLAITFQITDLRKKCSGQNCRVLKNKDFYLFDFFSQEIRKRVEVAYAEMSQIWKFPQDTSNL